MEKGKNVAVYCGSRYGINPAHTAFAGMAGELLAKNGYTMINGGGSVGLMGIAADAALAAGGKDVGIIPEVFIAAEQAHRHQHPQRRGQSGDEEAQRQPGEAQQQHRPSPIAVR